MHWQQATDRLDRGLSFAGKDFFLSCSGAEAEQQCTAQALATNKEERSASQMRTTQARWESEIDGG